MSRYAINDQPVGHQGVRVGDVHYPQGWFDGADPADRDRLGAVLLPDPEPVPPDPIAVAKDRAAALLAEVRPWLDLRAVLTDAAETALDAFLADVAEAMQAALDGGDPTWPDVPEALR